MKKKYNKPLINITTVRNEMGFCGSIVKDPGGNVVSEGHQRVSIDADEKGFNSSTGSDDWASNGWIDAQ